ncbi:MAG: hypothetical protein EP330_13425 [Deltaproteobacteria bacterium]|nr:MAG: hypothetical protein EP330_13425 [Deltaproteobacteria bacterium]
MIALLLGGKSAATVLVLLGYTAVGAGVGARLSRDGHSSATTASALAAWPLLLPLLGEAPPPVRRAPGSGPFASRIHTAFARLEEALGDPASAELPWDAEVGALRDVLLSADTRLALVDRLLDDEVEDEEVARSREALAEARERAAAEIEAVLSGVSQLRLQVGLLALQGEALPVTERLRELAARAGALDEVTRLTASA